MAPYNGYGTLKDSEQNCRSLVPKPPKKDLRKLVNKDGMILRFAARFEPRPDIGFAVCPPLSLLAALSAQRECAASGLACHVNPEPRCSVGVAGRTPPCCGDADLGPLLHERLVQP